MFIQIRTLCNKLFHNNMVSTVETYKRGHKHGMLNRNPLIFLVLTLILWFSFFKKKKKKDDSLAFQNCLFNQ